MEVTVTVEQLIDMINNQPEEFIIELKLDEEEDEER